MAMGPNDGSSLMNWARHNWSNGFELKVDLWNLMD